MNDVRAFRFAAVERSDCLVRPDLEAAREPDGSRGRRDAAYVRDAGVLEDAVGHYEIRGLRAGIVRDDDDERAMTTDVNVSIRPRKEWALVRKQKQLEGLTRAPCPRRPTIHPEIGPAEGKRSTSLVPNAHRRE